jgi:bacterioferritin-associated ferredoxin
MIVCVCKVVSEKELKAAIIAGSHTFDDLQVDLGVAIQCGKCEQCVRECIDDMMCKTA